MWGQGCATTRGSDDKVQSIRYPARVIRSSSARLGWLVAAVFQLLLPTFASVADARLEASSMRDATAHVEAPGETRCPPVHAADCAICRVLATRAAAAEAAALVVPAARIIDADAADAARRVTRARAPGDPPQRAPPTQA